MSFTILVFTYKCFAPIYDSQVLIVFVLYILLKFIQLKLFSVYHNYENCYNSKFVYSTCVYRYVEGAGAAAKFSGLRDVKFLSPTQLLSADFRNHCVRLVNFTKSPPETSTFAGKCTFSGEVDGHRLETARLRHPEIMEVNKFDPSVFVYLNPKALIMINLTTDESTKIHTYDSLVYDIRSFGNEELYFIQTLQVLSFNINSKEVNVIAGNGYRDASGPFENTSFNHLYGLFMWPYGGEEVLLVADRDSNRLLIYSAKSSAA